MKNIVLISFWINFSIVAFGQEKEEVNLLHVDSIWGKEIIQMPFWFAPEINYEGVEDIRFAEGWSKMDSPGFWTLIFAWDIDLKIKPTAKFFEDNLKLYYDGLMKVVNEDEELIIPKTKAAFKSEETDAGIITYKGKVHTYDAFTTKEVIELYVKIEVSYCEKTKNYIPLFRTSPKSFDSATWNMFKGTKLSDTVCNI